MPKPNRPQTCRGAVKEPMQNARTAAGFEHDSSKLLGALPLSKSKGSADISVQLVQENICNQSRGLQGHVDILATCGSSRPACIDKQIQVNACLRGLHVFAEFGHSVFAEGGRFIALVWYFYIKAR